MGQSISTRSVGLSLILQRPKEPPAVWPSWFELYRLTVEFDGLRYIVSLSGSGRRQVSFAKILWCREINSLYSFLNPCICYNLVYVPLLATLIRSLGSPLSPPWQFAAGEPRPSATGLCPETKESTTEVDQNG